MMSSSRTSVIPVITGPTASGKSLLAHELARKSGAEIISADSRQVYREMDIGTAKPSEQMLAEVRYHFIDERRIGEEFNAGDFAFEAWKRIETIIRRGKPVIVAGGSTLYVQGLIEGFSRLPAHNPAIRRRLQEELDSRGAEHLYRMLESIDPEQAATLDPTKTQRLVRSLEIIEITGRRVSELNKLRHAPPAWLSFVPVGLQVPREELYRRIEQRTDAMIEEGLVEEAKSLYLRYCSGDGQHSVNALETVGYQELFQYFDGKTTLEKAIGLIKQHTRNYAKRQLTFFKNRINVEWMAVPSDREGITHLADQLYRRFFIQ